MRKGTNPRTRKAKIDRKLIIRYSVRETMGLVIVAVAVLLASWWVFIPGILNTFLFILRTALEDRTLQTGLAGYPEFSRWVPYRLLPGVW